MRRQRGIASELLESYGDTVGMTPRAVYAKTFGSLLGAHRVLQAPVAVPASLATLLVLVLTGPLVGLAVLLIALAVSRWCLGRQKKRVVYALERDLPALLTSLASSVRAGIDPLKALGDAAHHVSDNSPLKQELEEFRIRLSRGGDEVELVNSLCAVYQHPDIELFKRCLVLSRLHGSSLAEPLHRIVRVVRQRQSFRRKTQAALAMHRMSAVGIAGCAALIGVMQIAVNRQGIEIALANPLGVVFLMSGVVLVCAGVAWMLSMGREEKLS